MAVKPKQIIDKVTDDINNANAIANENLKAAEAINQPEKPARDKGAYFTALLSSYNWASVAKLTSAAKLT